MKRVKPSIEPEDDRPSPAFQLVLLVWRETPFKSWIRLNHTMQDALSCAVRSGIAFRPGDIGEIYSKMRGGYWFGEHEWIYREAIEAGNVTAARAYESWQSREPFILDGNRLFVGAQVDMKYLPKAKGVVALVTSFKDSETAGEGEIVVCTYEEYAPHRRPGEAMCWPRGKPKNRVRFTVTEIRALERAREKAIKDAKKKDAEAATA